MQWLPTEVIQQLCCYLEFEARPLSYEGDRLFNYGERHQAEAEAAASNGFPFTDLYETEYYTDSSQESPPHSENGDDEDRLVIEPNYDDELPSGDGPLAQNHADLLALAKTCRTLYRVVIPFVYRRGGTARFLSEYAESVLTNPHLQQHIQILTIGRRLRYGLVTSRLATLCNDLFRKHGVIDRHGNALFVRYLERDTGIPNEHPSLATKLLMAVVLSSPNIEAVDIRFSRHIDSVPMAELPPMLPRLRRIRITDATTYEPEEHRPGYEPRFWSSGSLQWLLDAAPALEAISTTNVGGLAELHHANVSYWSIHKGYLTEDEVESLMNNFPAIMALTYRPSSFRRWQITASQFYGALNRRSKSFRLLDCRFNRQTMFKIAQWQATTVDLRNVRSTFYRVDLTLNCAPEQIARADRLHRLIPKDVEVLAIDVFDYWHQIMEAVRHVITCCPNIKAVYLRNRN